MYDDRDSPALTPELAQQIAINDAPIIPLYTSNTYEGMSVEIEGFEHSLSGRLGSIRSTWINR